MKDFLSVRHDVHIRQVQQAERNLKFVMEAYNTAASKNLEMPEGELLGKHQIEITRAKSDYQAATDALFSFEHAILQVDLDAYLKDAFPMRDEVDLQTNIKSPLEEKNNL